MINDYDDYDLTKLMQKVDDLEALVEFHEKESDSLLDIKLFCLFVSIANFIFLLTSLFF